MYAGESYHTLDEKNRLVIPKRLLDALETEPDREELFLTRGTDGCLFLFTRSQFDGVAREFADILFGERDARHFQRLLSRNAHPVSLDGQNRVLIPESLKQVAGIDREAAVVGVLNRIEIWAAESWRAYCDAHEPRYDDLADAVYVRPRPKEGGRAAGPSGTPPS